MHGGQAITFRRAAVEGTRVRARRQLRSVERKMGRSATFLVVVTTTAVLLGRGRRAVAQRRRHDPRGAAMNRVAGLPADLPLIAYRPSRLQTVPLQRGHLERPPHPLRRGVCAVRRPRRGRRAVDAARRSSCWASCVRWLGDRGEIRGVRVAQPAAGVRRRPDVVTVHWNGRRARRRPRARRASEASRPRRGCRDETCGASVRRERLLGR